MEDQGEGVDSIATLVRRYLSGDFDANGGPVGPGSVVSEDGAWRVHSLLILLAHGFPEQLMHKVLWCSEKDALAFVDAMRLRLPDAAAVRGFLAKRDKDALGEAHERGDPTSALGESEDVKQALNMLEYWTDRWLKECHSRKSEASS